MLIVRFEVRMRDDHQDIFSMGTAFGFFPAAAMESQVGLPPSDEERARLDEACAFRTDLTRRPERYFEGSLAVAGGKLLMLDRITGWWPEAGQAGLGRLRAEKDVDPSEWFFKAHFFQDPVQPGSLGIEAMIQALQLAMIESGLGQDLTEPRFESLATDRPLTWKYRGQVMPSNRLITTEIELTEVSEDERGVYALADAWLWVDGKRIYSATNLGMRIVAGEPKEELREGPDRGETPGQQARPEQESTPEGPSGATEDQQTGDETLDPQRAPWLLDHCPTWTLPALPMMSIVDRLAAAAQAHSPELRVVGLEDVEVERWVAFRDQPLRLRTEVIAEERLGSEKGAIDVRLSIWRDAATPALSRFETAATGRVLVAWDFCPPPEPLPPLTNPHPADDPYASGTLFHGPAFQLLREVQVGEAGSTSVLDASGGSVPRGILHPALLDAATHGIPHDALSTWNPEVPEDRIGYPRRLSQARFYGSTPEAGDVRCEARLESYDSETRQVVFHLQLSSGDRPWADLRLCEILLPKGPLGAASPDARRRFLRDRNAVAIAGGEGTLGLSRYRDGRTRLTEAEVATSDWLPGTVAEIYAATSTSRPEMTREVAIKDHVARQADSHPSRIWIEHGPKTINGRAQPLPLTRFPVQIRSSDGEIEVSDAGSPTTDLDPLRRFWSDYLDIEDWPVEDVYYGLIERFMRRLVVTDPDGLRALRGRSTLFLANHQVGIESVLFAVVAGATVGTPTTALAKIEHQTSWIGQLISHCFSYPGVEDPQVITFFERENMRSLPLIIRDLGRRMREEARSVLVHCEGTRSLTCRKPVEVLSGSFVDMARKADAAIVPVRFVGGLPAEPLTVRTEFPIGHGQQDYWLGAPILPEELAKLKYKDRRHAVMEAINSLGPSHEFEEPLPGNPEFAAEVAVWARRTGASQEHSTLFRTLQRLDQPGSEIQRLLQGAAAGRLETGDSPTDRWLAELATRLFGESGPVVHTPDNSLNQPGSSSR